MDTSSKNRIALERTVGRVVLDRMNGYDVGSVVSIFKDYGGDDEVTMSVLEKSFGSNFDEIADKGRSAVFGPLAENLRAELLKRGSRVASCSASFRDMFFHVDPQTPVGQLIGPRLQVRAERFKFAKGGNPID